MYRMCLWGFLIRYRLMFWTLLLGNLLLELSYLWKNLVIIPKYGNMSLESNYIFWKVKSIFFIFWDTILSRQTNNDGRASGFMSWKQFQPGTYKLKFNVKEYFEARDMDTFYPYAEVNLILDQWQTWFVIIFFFNLKFRLFLKSKVQELITMCLFFWALMDTQLTEEVKSLEQLLCITKVTL